MSGNPFYKANFKRSCALYELQYFKDLVKPRMEETYAEIPRLAPLRDHYGLIFDGHNEERLQISFSRRKMGVSTSDGKKWAMEKGAALVYSVGMRGYVAVAIYPAASD